MGFYNKYDAEVWTEIAGEMKVQGCQEKQSLTQLEKALLVTSTRACQGRKGDYLTTFHLTTVSKIYHKQEAVLAGRLN